MQKTKQGKTGKHGQDKTRTEKYIKQRNDK